MRFTNFLTFNLLLALPFAFAQPYAKPQNSSSIQWMDCPFELPAPGACGSLSVPLDYTDTDSGKTLNLTLYKIDAAVKPSKGSILINPGGPGNDAGTFLILNGAQLLT